MTMRSALEICGWHVVSVIMDSPADSGVESSFPGTGAIVLILLGVVM